ncbi:MAG: HNH endonuclease signature motif containing protein [Candidatus Pacearchaeota archaeon]|nr:HNH endonuclease signature motif containing protein [Candidatus Pacearchaeota archaeon]
MPKGIEGFQKGHPCLNSGRTHFKKGMTWEEMYGVDGAERKRKEQSEATRKRNLDNNPMKNKDAWNKGLTKETDERVKDIGKKTGKTRNSEEWKKTTGVELAKNLKNKLGGVKRNQEFKDKISKTQNDENWKATIGKDRAKRISATLQKVHLKDWQGFSKAPYDDKWCKSFMKDIRERDGCCMLCNIGFDDLKLLKRRNSIHHINYDKSLSVKENCIVLCNPCHSKTNFNREQWINFFQSLLSKKYGYNYSEQGVIILELKEKRC